MTDFLSAFGVFDFAIRDGLVLCLVALAVHLLLKAGIFAVPQVGLMAVGSYVSAVLSVDAGTSFPVALLGGTLAGTACGFLLAALLGRLNGIYLAIASIAFAEVVRVAVLNIPMTGGSQGKVGIPREANDIYIVGAVVATVVLMWLVNRSRHGLAMVAMREDPLMARHQGIDVFAYRFGLFGAAGLLSGLAGSLYVHMSGFVEPGQFSFDLLTQLIAVVVIGGMAYVSGSLVGGAIIFGLPHVLTGFADYQTLVNGAIIVLVIAFAPQGIVGYAADFLARKRGETRQPTSSGDKETPRSKQPAAAVVRESTPPKRIETADDTPAISMSGIAMHFGGIKALQDVSLTAKPGELLGLIGPNGSGKTTMLNVMSGVYKPTSGSGRLMGESLDHLWGQPHKLARMGLARTFQTIRLIDNYSVADNVLVGFHHDHSGTSATREALVHEVLREHGLQNVAHVRAGWLPYGIRRRVEIARAVVSRPKVLLLDEPTAGMNPQERSEVFEMIAALQRTGIAVVIVEHDVAMMGQYCDRLVVLDFGKVIAAGDTSTVLRSKEVISAYVGGVAQA